MERTALLHNMEGNNAAASEGNKRGIGEVWGGSGVDIPLSVSGKK
jgi:hypothetical protein